MRTRLPPAPLAAGLSLAIIPLLVISYLRLDAAAKLEAAQTAINLVRLPCTPCACTPPPHHTHSHTVTQSHTHTHTHTHTSTHADPDSCLQAPDYYNPKPVADITVGSGPPGGYGYGYGPAPRPGEFGYSPSYPGTPTAAAQPPTGPWDMPGSPGRMFGPPTGGRGGGGGGLTRPVRLG